MTGLPFAHQSGVTLARIFKSAGGQTPKPDSAPMGRARRLEVVIPFAKRIDKPER